MILNLEYSGNMMNKVHAPERDERRWSRETHHSHSYIYRGKCDFRFSYTVKNISFVLTQPYAYTHDSSERSIFGTVCVHMAAWMGAFLCFFSVFFRCVDAWVSCACMWLLHISIECLWDEWKKSFVTVLILFLSIVAFFHREDRLYDIVRLCVRFHRAYVCVTAYVCISICNFHFKRFFFAGSNSIFFVRRHTAVQWFSSTRLSIVFQSSHAYPTNDIFLRLKFGFGFHISLHEWCQPCSVWACVYVCTYMHFISMIDISCFGYCTLWINSLHESKHVICVHRCMCQYASGFAQCTKQHCSAGILITFNFSFAFFSSVHMSKHCGMSYFIAFYIHILRSKIQH